MKRPISRATSEWVILRSLWAVQRRLEATGRHDGATIEEIWNAALERRDQPIDYRTAATQLRTLASKGLVVSQRQGRKLYYRPTLDEETAVTAEIETFLDQVIHDDPRLLAILVRLGQARLEEARAEAARRQGGEKG
jgi:predicted transcriptional regulator